MKENSQTYGPYSAVVKAGDMYFISGHLGVNNQTKQAPVSIEEQTHLMFSNLKATLDNVGLSLSDIVKTTVFLASIDDFDKMNAIYVQYFNNPRPARSCVEVSSLPNVTTDDSQVLIEIEAVAYEGGQQ